MKGIFLALCLICLSAAGAVAQAPNSRSPQRTPAGAPPASAPAQKANAPKPGPQTPPPAQSATVSDDFVIGPEDVLEITVWREPDLTTKAVVRPDGKIGMTLLGDVQASGLTTTTLKATIAKGLTRYVAEPEVSVVVVEIKSQMVHLIGAVARPGAYQLGGPLTVMELLARAGGVADTAKREEIAIVRTDGKMTQRIPFNYKAFVEGKDLTHNILLKNGDVVIVR